MPPKGKHQVEHNFVAGDMAWSGTSPRFLLRGGLHFFADSGTGPEAVSFWKPVNQVFQELRFEVGYREPYIWADVLQGATQLLEEGGILLMYDTDTSTMSALFLFNDFQGIDSSIL